ncbi:unnamed protein product [Cylindrotheca closterium]|uniref:Uroporphyrinogen decarboxylase (URO-D) domain-containing protein n=1 Tax=Cylindrotheca closterium TaxID=2856 RepID=A0AAD2FIL4_9STRA|nr:unnamed protein product [Cylindrotheca closterium]
MLLNRKSLLSKATFALTSLLTSTTFQSSSCSSTASAAPTPQSANAAAAAVVVANGAVDQDPLLLRVARGEAIADDSSPPPVWMMRQAGRHMKAYRDLVHDYPTFRQRSEIPRVALEISLQPFKAYNVDGIILFSDILTPLPQMGIQFKIGESGTIEIETPLLDCESVFQSGKLKRCPDYDDCVAGTVLQHIQQHLKDTNKTATVLGFIGLPYTLATYLVEGKTAASSGFAKMTQLVRERDLPKVQWLHDMLTLLADNLADYACFQIESGAQVIQVFDSWAGHLNHKEYQRFALPYQQRVIARIHKRYPDTPIIIYMAPAKYSKNGQRLKLLAQSGANVVSVDHTVSLKKAIKILRKYPNVKAVQGNLDPKLLRDASLEDIRKATQKLIAQAKAMKMPHIVNLGHGILPDTPEEKAAAFVQAVHSYPPPL